LVKMQIGKSTQKSEKMQNKRRLIILYKEN